jgi:hypothetical protein
MSAADSEAQTARFSDFIRQHPVLAAGSAIAGGGIAAYLAESNGLDVPYAAGIGVAGAAAGVLLSSLAYLERPAYVRDHPMIAGFQFLGVTGLSAFFIHDLSGGVIEVPLAVLLGAPLGIGAVAITAQGYDWIQGWLGALSTPINAVKEAAAIVGTGTSATIDALPDAPEVLAQAVTSGEIKQDLQDSVLETVFGVAGSKIQLDQVRVNGTAAERALCDKIIALLAKQTFSRLSNEETQQLAFSMAALRKMLDDNNQDNWGRPMVSTADARFTTNHDNPVAQQERDYDQIIADERALTNTYNEQHKEEVDAFVEEVHDLTAEEVMARAKAGPFAQGPKK